MLEICLFGRTHLLFEGAPLAFRAPARALTLLAYLLLQRDRPLARDAVAVAFWPDLGESDARARLRTHLHYLIEILPKIDRPWLLADKRTVQWNPAAPVCVDVIEFERLARDPATAAEAVTLYTGDLLAGVDDACLEVPRARLRERQIATLLALIDTHRKLNDGAAALAYAQRLLGIDPWREDCMRALIELRSEAGDRAGAAHAYQRFAQRLKDELGVEPMAETTRAYEAAAASPKAPVTRLQRSAATHNLPSYLTSFIGRTAEIAALQAAIATRRLVTLTGCGGSGKTRLAVEALRTLPGHFEDGMWFVELAALSHDEQVVCAIAGTLGLAERSETGVVEAMRSRNALLVLDNCEHLPGLPRLVTLLAARCPGVTLLATSREALHVTGERIQRLAPLPLPAVVNGAVAAPVAELADSPAVQLLLARLADAASPIDLRRTSERERRALLAIVRRLDGLPLAIELAAARAGMLTLAALADRLDERFTFLTGGSRAALPRHQTMLAAIDWSHDALDATERSIFARMAVFAGGWDLQAAGALCVDLGITPSELADRLESLVNKSLIVTQAFSGTVRYDFLETIAGYALERLEAAGELGDTRRNHATHYADLAACEMQRRVEGAPAKRMMPELQNVRAALRWALDAGNDPRVAASLAESFAGFADATPLVVEALSRCEAALAALGPKPPARDEAPLQLARSKCLAFMQSVTPGVPAERRAVALFWDLGDKARTAYAMSYLADALRRAGCEEESREVGEGALSLARDAGDARTLGHALATSSRLTQDVKVRRRHLLDALAAYESLGCKAGIANILMRLGECAFKAGDPGAALQYARHCLVMLSGVEGEQHPLTIVLANAAAYAVALGRIDEAAAFANAALGMAHRQGDRRREAWAFQHLAAVAFAQGAVRRAARLAGASNERGGAAVMEERSFTERTVYDQTIAKLRDALSPADLDELMADGRRLSRLHAAPEAIGLG